MHFLIHVFESNKLLSAFISSKHTFLGVYFLLIQFYVCQPHSNTLLCVCLLHSITFSSVFISFAIIIPCFLIIPMHFYIRLFESNTLLRVYTAFKHIFACVNFILSNIWIFLFTHLAQTRTLFLRYLHSLKTLIVFKCVYSCINVCTWGILRLFIWVLLCTSAFHIFRIRDIHK